MTYRFQQPQVTQAVAIGAASVASTNPFGAQTWAIRVVATGNCHINIGQAPVATATSAYVAANQKPEYIRVNPGDKIAVIQDGSATGNVFVTELSQ